MSNDLLDRSPTLAQLGRGMSLDRSQRCVLTVFARQPHPGRVKTRLARALGDERAAEIYGAFVRDLAARFAQAPFAVHWAVAPPEGGFAERFGIAPAACRPQVGADLGERMHFAFEEMARAGFTHCALVGSDLPQLPVERVERAFAALEDVDLVLGPARDGGYYLIAQRAPHDVFTGIRWSTSRVLAATLARAESLALRVHLLEEDFDVDGVADLERLRGILADGMARRAMPATVRALGLA